MSSSISRRIDLKMVPIFVLVCSDQKRERIKQVLSGYNYTIVEGITSYRGEKIPRLCGAVGHARLIREGIKTGGPFVILEDDCQWFDLVHERCDEIEIPSDADAVFIGISIFGLNPVTGYACMLLLGSDYSENCVRIFNMLSAHAILILSSEYALSYYACVVEAATRIEKGESHLICDMLSSRLGFTHQVYALKKPIFFQDATAGGEEMPTRFVIDERVRLSEPDSSLHQFFESTKPLAVLTLKGQI